MCARSGVENCPLPGARRGAREVAGKGEKRVVEKNFTSPMRVNWIWLWKSDVVHAKWRRSRFHFVIAQQRGWKIWLRSCNDVRLPNCLSNILHRWNACYDNNRRRKSYSESLGKFYHSQLVEFVEKGCRFLHRAFPSRFRVFSCTFVQTPYLRTNLLLIRRTFITNTWRESRMNDSLTWKSCRD